MRRMLIGLGAFALSLAALPAWADVRYTPPRVTWVGEPVAAVAGQPLAGTLEIRVSKPTVITNLRLEGAGWNARLVAAPVKLTYTSAGGQTVRLEGTPADAHQPLILRFDADGVPQEHVLDLSPEAIERALRPRATVAKKASPDESTFRPPGPEPLRPGVQAAAPASALRGKPDRALNDTDDPPSVQARNIRVRGRFVYSRSDGATLGADGVAVRVYDEDFGFDEHLATGVTDWNGNFDITFNWDPCLICDSQPDLYLILEAANNQVWVKSTDLFASNYAWQTGTHEDYAGTDLGFGTFGSADEDVEPALHIQTDITRDWRWYLNHEGYDPPGLAAYWPDGSSGAWYSPGEPSLHFSSARGWREDSHAHEYGHHFIYTYAVSQDPDYCNGICDASASDCGHCLWCRETNHDAWNEGWPNWICHVQTTSYASDYGRASMNTRDMEDLSTCSEDGAWHAPEITEGFLSALLQDIWDSANEDDPNAPGTWQDRLSLGTNEIFDVTDFDGPLNPTDLLTKFKNRYPSYKEQLWETAKNCRYDPDTAIPGAVTNLTSPSHAVGSTSPDPTVQFSWTRASDDWSGPSGYSVLVRAGSTALPDATQDIGDVTTYTTGVLTPGTYYFCIRTQDRAGRWDDGYAWYGPFTIRAPEPANLTYDEALGGWDYPIVPRLTNDATTGNVDAPTSILPGNMAGTYVNLSGRNTGESATSVSSSIRMFLDDAQFASGSVGVVNAGQWFAGVNWGPYVLRGGRHTMEIEYDATDAISETDETDNWWARQWVWNPYAVATGTRISRVAPPDANGGRDAIQSGSSYYNCDGLRFSSSGTGQYWHAVWTYAIGASDNYDCRIHFPTSSPDTGFGAYRGYSTRGAGMLDAVLVNRNKVSSPTDWDVGVLNLSNGTSYYYAKHVASTVMSFGDSIVVMLPLNEMMLLKEFYVGSAQYGPVSITARIIEGSGPLTLAWFNEDFQVGDILDRTESAVVSGTEQARIDVDVSEAGWNGIALYRDPTAGVDTVRVVLEVETTPPDFTPYWAAGWYSPLVPRPAFDGTPASVPEPDTLHGNAASTYLNIAVRNQGPTGIAGMLGQVYLDGVYSWYLAYPMFPGGATSPFNWNAAWTVRGGRHSLGVYYDQVQQIEEMYEDNNVYGTQYVWSPYPLTAGVAVTRAAPPDMTGGYSEVTHAPYGIYLNCDGLRMPKLPPTGADGFWIAVATMPGASSNVDVRLHELSPGTLAAFRSNLGMSSWGTGLSDYMVVNFNKTSQRPFDVGVLRAGTGTQSYTAELVRSVYRSGPSGRWGPFTLGAGHILHLHELYLATGTYTVDVFDQGGKVDWGLTVHKGDLGIQTKSTALEDGVVWTEGAGRSELATVVVPASGYYCVGVWKRGAADLAKDGQYILQVRSLAVDAPDAVPARTALGTVYPNPLRSSATVAFDLSAEGETAIEIYDVHGARVRTLAGGRWPAGRHQAVWNGETDSGRPAAPGIYVLHFSAGKVNAARKLVKLD